jgi:hypothetical protein
MTRWERVNALFHAARARPVGDREAFLATACREDLTLRVELESLLAADDANSASALGSRPMVGTRVGDYEITAFLAAGSMGEVYRARDTRLGRDVALKILPLVFVADPDRRARFEREARLLASLNHRNIATIYGLVESDGVHALALELIDGETLANRIAHGRIPVEEALKIARQIAEALEAAHEQGIIHRDLKPANIKLTRDSTVKVLDFGLTKLALSSDVAATRSPKETAAVTTNMGMVIGTPAYMSPEQARGEAVDKRSDIWAFGCVLFEMLTGHRAFGGEDVTDTLAAVVRAEPAWDALPDRLSPSMRQFLRRCLQKHPNQRLHDIADMRLALEGAFEATALPTAQPLAVAQPAWRRALPVAASFTIGGLVVGLTALSLWPAAAPPAVNRFEYLLPEDRQFRNTGRPVLTISPDGRRFVYNATGGLYLRTMGELAARLVPGTEDAVTNPTFSPDGQSVAYFQDNHLKRIAISGGAPVVVCEAINPFGMSWERDNTILFGQAAGIMRVSASGGTPELVVRAEKGEQVHGPQLLPDGDSVLFSVTAVTGGTRWDQADIVVQSLRTGQRIVSGAARRQRRPLRADGTPGLCPGRRLVCHRLQCDPTGGAGRTRFNR